jgi:hypothetical protein
VIEGGVALVWQIETGLKCGRWLPRKLRNTVLMQHHDKRRAASEIVVADLRGGTFPEIVLHRLRQVEPIPKIETGLERGQRLPRKPRNTLILLEREKK